MDYVENKKPIFELNFSTKFLSEVDKKRDSTRAIIQEKLDVIDKEEHLNLEEKMSMILSIRRREEENLHIKMLVSSGLFNAYIIHCEYLIYACRSLNALENSILITHLTDRLSLFLEKLKKHNLKSIENLIFKVDNSLASETTDEDMKLFSIDILVFLLFSSAEKVNLFDEVYRRTLSNTDGK